MGSQTICPVWPGTSMLLILASQVTGIIGMSHQSPAKLTSLLTRVEGGEGKCNQKEMYSINNRKVKERKKGVKI
jgi:hypothetical protein